MIRERLPKIGVCTVLSLFIWGQFLEEAVGKTAPVFPCNKPTDFFSLEPNAESNHYKKPSRTATATLSGIVQEAIAYHPSIAADKEALSASDDVIDQAEAGYLPSVDLRASLGRENIRRSFNLNILNPLESKGTIALTRSDPSMAIRQILFDGMGTAARVDKAHSQRFQAKGTLGVTTDTAIVDAATATVDVRRLQRLLQIVNNNIRFHQIMRDRIAEIVQAGALSITDLHQLEARLQDTFIAKSNIESDLEVARAKFIEVVGKAPPVLIKRIHLPAYLMPASVEIAVRMAMENNNAIKVAKSNVQVAEANYKEAGAKLVPTVTFELEAQRDRNVNGTSGFQNRLSTMVVARQNVFSGGADMAKSRETVKRRSEALSRVNLARRQAERTIHGSWGEARNAYAKSAHLTKLIREKRLIRSNYVSEFEIGKRTLVDVLDAANDVFLTEASRITSDATADINTIILSVGTGQFHKFIKRKDDADCDDEEHKPQHDLIYTHGCDPNLQLSPYHYANEKLPFKEERAYKVKKIAQKRKTIFERRKEERLNAHPAKAMA